MNVPTLFAEGTYLLLLLGLLRCVWQKGWWLPASLAVLLGVPALLRAGLGDPSAATLVVGGLLFCGRVFAASEVARVSFLIALPVILFATTSLPIDLYPLGFSAWWLPSVFALLALLYLLFDRWSVPLWFALALLFTVLDFSESSNFWDAVVDFPTAVTGGVLWLYTFLFRH